MLDHILLIVMKIFGASTFAALCWLLIGEVINYLTNKFMAVIGVWIEFMFFLRYTDNLRAAINKDKSWYRKWYMHIKDYRHTGYRHTGKVSEWQPDNREKDIEIIEG